jgi:hypothetical protein
MVRRCSGSSWASQLVTICDRTRSSHPGGFVPFKWGEDRHTAPAYRAFGSKRVGLRSSRGWTASTAWGLVDIVVQPSQEGLGLVELKAIEGNGLAQVKRRPVFVLNQLGGRGYP